ncbi:uncharacterized protein LAJ45_08676 [Morchella importuna]|uniref:uncharacterized protein n=1 Tax=Morchella importuna TaxID=1174673 RepID=UPI001E8E44F5|nr:uncharacterized protein LAJ45_08676 [Morchella importuna]KAH8147198.1 hypothetical protein LAJ45_08676 [Morchella importuna]
MTMSEVDRASETDHVIVLTPEEKRVFGQLFQAADRDGLSVVTGELAVKFFEKSGLNPRILGEIWGIADTQNRGLLTKVGFSVALRLIGQAQNGQHPRPELAQHPGPLPVFEGVNIINTPAPPVTSSPPPPPPPPTAPVQQAQLSGPGGGMIRVPPITIQDVERFTGLFEKSGAQDGVLPGDVAKSIFQRAKLPNQTLGLIWNLADRQHRGVLGPAEFVVAMHLITCSKNGSLPVLPQILPPGFYEAAAAACSIALSRQFTPPVTQALPRQGTGDWAISAADKARFDQVFLTIDKQNRGFITGEEAVPFFGNSNLPEDILATIWDLADITKAGRLNRDEFAIAMHLIRQQRNSPGAGSLPEVLPMNLIPPSMRQQVQFSHPLPSSYEPQAPPAPPLPPKAASDDLFDLDFSGTPASAPAPPASAPPPASLSPFDTDVFGMKSAPPTGATAGAPPGMASQAPNFFATTARTFVPTSGFGQAMISPSQTGGSTTSATANRPAPPMMDDLLGDADPEVSKKLTNDTTELANLSNNIGTLTKQTTELKGKRASTEQELSALSSQKAAIEAQLATLRAAYEREAEHAKKMEDQLAASKADTNRLRIEYASVEQNYNELISRKQEVSSALDSDKRENENLSQRMKALNAENINLRQELERLQSQARQQKGLVAINKKQVATGESERDRLQKDIEDTRSNIASPPPPGSPTPSSASINTNPFHRRSPPAAADSAFSPSPFAPGAAAPQAPSLDDVFGPAFAVSPMPTGSSLTSFHRAQTEVNPPASAHGGDEFSRPDTPNWATPSDTPARERDAFVKAEDRRGSFSVKSDAGTEASAKVSFLDGGKEKTNNDRSPFASVMPVEKNTTGSTTGGERPGMRPSEKRDSFSSYGTPSQSIPGAFPSIEGMQAPIKPTATGESTMSNKSSGSGIGKSAFGSMLANRADPKDFDDAFKTFSVRTQERQNTGGSATGSLSASRFDKEFPPIEEVGPDDDSDSDVDKGFDDNFTSSPIQTHTQPATTAPPPTTSPAPMDQGISRPPALSAQQSPPAYTPGSKAGEKNPFPEYSGLLPSRTDPMKHEGTTPGGGTNTVIFPGSAPTSPQHTGSNTFGQNNSIFSSSPSGVKGQSLSANNTGNVFSASPPIVSKNPAPSAANTAQPSANPIISDEFDDEFGDLAEAKEADDKGDDNDFGGFDDFNPVFDSQSSHSNNHTASGNAMDADEGFTTFNFNIDSPSAQTQKQGQQQQHEEDWDAIFDPPQPPRTQTNGGTEETSGQSGTGPVDVEAGGVALAGESDVASEDAKITELTGLGFGRESSVKALEKHGYNLEQAANSLFSEAESK